MSPDFCLPYPYGDISESECGDRFTPNSIPQFVLSLIIFLMIHNNSKLCLSSFEFKEQPPKKRYLKLICIQMILNKQKNIGTKVHNNNFGVVEFNVFLSQVKSQKKWRTKSDQGF
jgi:hypothetical protein